MPERPSEKNPAIKTNNDIVYTGRRVLKWSIDKEELTAEKIRKILPQILREHDKNVSEIEYLYEYYK